MNKKIDIEEINNRTPFTVPDGYFLELKSDIRKSCSHEEKESFSVLI